MIRGIQTAASAMRTQMARQEVLAMNMANYATPGYKQEYAPVDGISLCVDRVARDSQQRFALLGSSLPEIGSLGTDVGVARVEVDFRQAPLEETHRPLDVALEGDGFLEVRTPEGDCYSRGGALHLDASNRLVTDEGYFVLGPDGQPLTLGSGTVSVDRHGTISVEGGGIGQLSVVEFEPGTLLAKLGNGLYTPDNPDVAPPMRAVNTVVRQGFLERSNVDHISTMTEMLSGLRAYQASQRMLLAQDELLGQAVNAVGRV